VNAGRLKAYTVLARKGFRGDLQNTIKMGFMKIMCEDANRIELTEHRVLKY
jgi:hypothetical protein